MSEEEEHRAALNRVLDRLDAVVESGDQWLAICPAHADERPSLAVRSVDGRVLVHCHAGCSTEDVLHAIGLTFADLCAAPRRTGRGRLEARYVYINEDGSVVREKQRREGKRFVWRHLDDDGRWQSGAGPSPRLIYRLDEVAAARSTGRTVLVCEGEKDVETARTLGAVATCSPDGAAKAGGRPKWRAEFGDQLAGLAEVVIVCDRDAPGYAHALATRDDLVDKADRVRIVEPRAGKDLTDHVEARHSLAELVELDVETLRARVGESAPDGPAASPPRLSGGADLVRFALERYAPIRSTDGGLFMVPRSGPRLALAIGPEFRHAFSAEVWDEFGVACGATALSAALETLKGLAARVVPSPVYLRAAHVDGRVFVDLGDADGRVVEVEAGRWRVREAGGDVPVFRRTAASMPLPEPVRGGSLEELRALLGVDGPTWLQIRGWLAAAFVESVPRPLLWATGVQGSGKSSRARMVACVIDPTERLGREPGRNLRDDTVSAAGRFVASWDNVTSASSATSDHLCRLVTGGGDDRRELYTDDSVRTVTYRRTGVGTSIVLPTGFGPDLLERLVWVRFGRIQDAARRSERELWREFADAHGRILGAVLDDLSGVLREWPAVAGEARPWPRMADFAQLVAALDRALGLPDAHLWAYAAAVDGMLRERAEDDPFTAAVLAVVEAESPWSGTAEELRAELRLRASEVSDESWWPKTARAVVALLDKASEALRHAGVDAYRPEERTNRGRLIHLRRISDGCSDGRAQPSLIPRQPSQSKAAGQGTDRVGRDGCDGLPGRSPSLTLERNRENRHTGTRYVEHRATDPGDRHNAHDRHGVDLLAELFADDEREEGR